MNPLQRLQNAGVSLWLDSLSRDLLDSGHLARLVADWSVSGATSNPTIFAAAMDGTERYDAQLRQLAASSRVEAQELFFQLALDDVRRAADLLRPTYEASSGTDGFVSFQCTPDLAGNTAGMVRQATELWERLDRPNVMIKVPATPAGVPAVAEITGRGINVNITLLFSVHRYAEVIDAYEQGLEQLLSQGQRIDSVASVASFFVSRVDTAVDAQLPEGSRLLGRAGVANSRHALQVHQRRLQQPSWRRLAAAGGRAQRLLWASTAAKDPRYLDTKYLEELAAPGTVITAPEATLRAFADHGRVGGTGADAGTDELIAALFEQGIDLERVAADLEKQGVAAFQQSYRQLLDHLASRVAQLVPATSPTEGAVIVPPLAR